MPRAKFKTVVNASYERVNELLFDKMENPRKYISSVLHSSILERDDGYIVRSMYLSGPIGMTVREKIYDRAVDAGHEFVYEYLENESYSGFFYNTVTRLQGRDDRVELEYQMDWTPHPGVPDGISPDSAEKMVELGVMDMKNAAENPVQVPEWVREFYEAADSKDGSLAPLLTEDCVFRIGNGPEVIGRDRVEVGSQEMKKNFAALKHDYVQVSEAGGCTFVECWVNYTTLEGAVYLVPFLTVFERSQDKISSVKAFGDMSPVQYGWPAP